MAKKRRRISKLKTRIGMYLSNDAVLIVEAMADEENRSVSSMVEHLIQQEGRKYKGREMPTRRKKRGIGRLKAAEFIPYTDDAQWMEDAGSSEPRLLFMAEEIGGMYKVGLDTKTQNTVFIVRDPQRGELPGPHECVMVVRDGLDTKPFDDVEELITWAARFGRKQEGEE